MTLARLPMFVPEPGVAVSGRMMTKFGSPVPVPAVLTAYHTPGRNGLGSAVYLVAAVGPSTGTWPFFPVGGFLVGSSSLNILEAVDETDYSMEESTTIEIDSYEFDVEICDAESLLAETIPLVTEALGLSPWDEAVAAQWVSACEGWDYFDQFMALDVHQFQQPEN